MPKNPIKPRTVADLIGKEQFDQLQAIAKKFSEQQKALIDSLRPTLERITELAKFNIPEMNRHVMFNYVPTDVLILRELRQLNTKKEKVPRVLDGSVVIVYDTHDISLNRPIDGKVYSYDLSENGKRKKLLDLLLGKKGYIQTKDLKELLSCPTTQAVAKIVQTFNDYASSSLKLKKIKVIDSKKGSGYRINPKIYIEKE